MKFNIVTKYVIVSLWEVEFVNEKFIPIMKMTRDPKNVTE